MIDTYPKNHLHGEPFLVTSSNYDKKKGPKVQTIHAIPYIRPLSDVIPNIQSSGKSIIGGYFVYKLGPDDLLKTVAVGSLIRYPIAIITDQFMRSG